MLLSKPAAPARRSNSVSSWTSCVARARRPPPDHRRNSSASFSKAARPDVAEPLYEAFCEALREQGVEVATGSFRARMVVELANDGPVTVLLET